MINIDEFSKVNLRIGKIKEIKKDRITINCNNKDYEIKIKLKVKERDKILIIINNDKIIIPVLNNDIPIIPEQDIDSGSKVK